MECSLVSLSIHELARLRAIEHHLAGRLTQIQVAVELRLSLRHIKRLVRRYRLYGPGGLASQRRGRPSNRRTNPELLRNALELVSRHYPDFGPTFASEKLRERHGIQLDHETLRRAMIVAGLWTVDRQRRGKPHPPRARRPCFGELVQLDGSDHPWFEDRAPRCTLLVAIDDATSALLALYFAPEETTLAYFQLMRAYLTRCGRPLGLYTDRSSIFRLTAETSNGETLTQFGRAMQELNIELICANSPQAKGRIERANKTLQDRLVKELRLRRIHTLEEANAYAEEYRAAHNERFARLPECDVDAHRQLDPDQDLDRILVARYARAVSPNGCITYENRVLALDESTLRSLRGRKVEIHQNASGALVIDQQGRRLPYTELVRRTRHAVILDRKAINRRVPNAKKAHTPSSDHPWRRYPGSIPKGTLASSSRGHQT